MGAAEYVLSLPQKPKVTDAAIEKAIANATAAFNNEGEENPYTVHQELQQVMNDLVGIIREGSEMRAALEKLEKLKARASKVTVEGNRQFNPGWHLALDLQNMLLVSESIARSALEREESRGGHTRNDFPTMDPKWRQIHIACSYNGQQVVTEQQSLAPMPPELMNLFDQSELSKYLTEAELVANSQGSN
jgi:succinate dehydrogenase / fumarate reductase flavoprotein subunit